MMFRRIAATFLLLLCAITAAGLPIRARGDGVGAPARPNLRAPIPYGIAPDTGQYLPDTTVLASVGERVIRVGEYVEAYFGVSPDKRPQPDSAGRVEFLNSMITREVLARVARDARRPESFEDRSIMREHTQRVLSNTLFQRAVVDSVRIEESEIAKIFSQMGYELRLRRLIFRDPELAERIRKGIVAGRITWPVAVAAQGLPLDAPHRDGALGWVRRRALDPEVATTVFDLKPSETSPVLFEGVGHTVYQALERRTIGLPTYEALHSSIYYGLKGLRTNRRSDGILGVLGARVGMTHDTTNIVWAARQFPDVLTSGQENGLAIEVDTRVPEFDPADTSRVLARFRGGQFTLGAFVDWYAAQSPYLRTSATTFEALQHQVDVAILEPAMADLARERGLDRDSLAMRMIDARREELAVDHMNEDSILSRVRITPKERRAFYDQHTAGFITYARVQYVQFKAASVAEADSLVARLKSGVAAATILREDSLAGRARGEILWRSEEDHGMAFQKILFGELKPGQYMVADEKGGRATVIQSLVFDPGHQIPFEESQGMIDASLQNIAAEKILIAFLARHRRQMRVTEHPEWVMRIRMMDPSI